MAAKKPPNRRKKTKRKRKSGLSYPRLFITTAVVLLFILGLSRLNGVDDKIAERPSSQPTEGGNGSRTTLDNRASRSADSQQHSENNKQNSNEVSRNTLPHLNEGEYSFYSMLKDFTVKVPEQNNYQPKKTKTQPDSYLIQAGSFKTRRQAEQRRAELILLGLEPTVSDTVNDQGNTWYRVRLGPFYQRSDMASARQTIITNGMEAMVMAR